MSKVGSHNSFGHFKHKLWPKERPGVKLAIWLPTIKSQESPRFPCVQVACHIPLESSWQGLELFFKLHFNWRFLDKLWAPKVARVPTLGIFRLPFGSPGTKCHLGASPVTRHKVYYKWEGGGFSQVWAMVSLVSPSLFVARPNTKNAPAMH
jgi:hypothetical protein